MVVDSTYEPLLPGIGLIGYRSFATWQQFEFPTKVTVLAGINNSGKSNVLRFLQDYLHRLKTSEPGQSPRRLELPTLDRPRGFIQEPDLQVALPVRPGTFGVPVDMTRPGWHSSNNTMAAYQEILIAVLAEDHDVAWPRFAVSAGASGPPAELVDEVIARWPRWESRYNQVLTSLGGGPVNPRDVMARLLTSISSFNALPPVVTISSARQVLATDEVEPDWLSGRGIIRSLGALQNPVHDKWDEARHQWHAINRFVHTVLGDDSASLNIPSSFEAIQVETPARVLPLASLGSGIEQVIVLASAATVTRHSLVCIEEPETNLHPLLQKKLVRYLCDQTDNQYIVATHSSHILDFERSSTYHLRFADGGTQARLAKLPHQMVEICNDLGYRPSDLLQANCVVWVEGPSDRIYLRRWLGLVAPELREGVEYSIMFYGGKLLAHLTASEAALDDFIELRQLNRASAIVIDSDKTSARQQLNRTKQRIESEFEAASAAPGFSWVTSCYTVENYVPQAVLGAAVQRVHPSAEWSDADRWVNPLSKDRLGLDADKVGVAHAVADSITLDDLHPYDLKARVTKLAGFIAAANT